MCELLPCSRQEGRIWAIRDSHKQWGGSGWEPKRKAAEPGEWVAGNPLSSNGKVTLNGHWLSSWQLFARPEIRCLVRRAWSHC